MSDSRSVAPNSACEASLYTASLNVSVMFAEFALVRAALAGENVTVGAAVSVLFVTETAEKFAASLPAASFSLLVAGCVNVRVTVAPCATAVPSVNVTVLPDTATDDTDGWPVLSEKLDAAGTLVVSRFSLNVTTSVVRSMVRDDRVGGAVSTVNVALVSEPWFPSPS